MTNETAVVQETSQPALCEVCGYDTSIDGTAVRFVCDTKAEPMKLLALLCIKCYAAGILFAAKMASSAGDLSVPDKGMLVVVPNSENHVSAAPVVR